jgi:hypothetical protein
MAHNVGGKDAWLRTTLAVGLIGVAGIFNERGTFVAGALLSAGVLVVTALCSRCPLYAALGIRTCEDDEALGD